MPDFTESIYLGKWKAAASRFEEINAQLVDPSTLAQPSLLGKLNKERQDIEELAQLFSSYQDLLKQIQETEQMLQDPGVEADLLSMASEEAEALNQRRKDLESQAVSLLSPQDPQNEKSTFVEIRAGTGGEEAALFAGVLFRMYVKFAEKKRLRVEVVNSNETGMGGYREVVFLVEGKGAFGLFRFESGVHRVQRVPATEASGRIHTSTVTVAVMPEVDEVDVHIEQKDLRIDTFCSSGPGGQGVNTTYSGVRITHHPTGVVVTCQDERSQLKNRNKAMRNLRARIMEAEREKQEAVIAQDRKAQVGTGERSEKIRTYNYSQNRVTDHRIGLTLHKLEQVLEGNLEELVDGLQAAQSDSEASEAM